MSLIENEVLIKLFFMTHNKIFYIANVRLPTEKAHGMQIMKSCEAFARAGMDVELVVPRRRNLFADDPFEYYTVERNFTITPILVIDTVRFGRLGFLVELFSFLIVARLYLRAKDAIVYTREEAVGFFFKDFVLEMHAIPEHVGNLRLYLWKKAKGLTVLTRFIKDRLVQSGVSEQRIFISPDAVDLRLFDLPLSKEAAREKLSLPLNRKIVLYAGSFFLYDWKGVDILLESAKQFEEPHLFVLVGGSKEEVNKARASWGRDNILFLGHQPPRTIPTYLKAADVLVIPNKKGSTTSEYYTSPLKLFEYMASGRPIIASRIPSLEEVVSAKEVLFFEPNNVEDLVLGIRQIFQDESFAQSLACSARKQVEGFTWDMRMKKVLEKIMLLC